MDTSAALPEALLEVLGPHGLLIDAADLERHCGDVLGNRGLRPRAVLRPRTTAEVSRVLAICNAAGIPVVVQGGRTGLVLSCLPQSADEVALSLERMTDIESIDVDSATAIVQSGVVLQALQDRLEPLGLAFPLDLGGRGSCTIGGNVSTNAGGNRVIRHGMTRDLVLGIEAVLADGTVIDSLRPLIKNNTGIDLKQLFIGSEGVLGVVTRIAVRLIARPAQRAVAFCACRDFSAVRGLLNLLRREMGGELSAYEVLWRAYYTRAVALVGGAAPLADGHAFYVLVETSGQAGDGLQQRLERALGTALEEGTVADAVIAKSLTEIDALWRMRDLAIEVSRTIDPIVPFDISVGIGRMERFVDDMQAAVRAVDPRCESIVFGHAADGNLHIAVHRPPDRPDAFDAIARAVYDAVARHEGSVSAEHGIGVLKRAYLGHTRSPAEIAVMRSLKATLDPRNTLNPGRIFER
jgi:FAD/FMN-containing dehydrogenase